MPGYTYGEENSAYLKLANNTGSNTDKFLFISAYRADKHTLKIYKWIDIDTDVDVEREKAMRAFGIGSNSSSPTTESGNNESHRKKITLFVIF